MLDSRKRSVGSLACAKSAWSAPALVVAILFAADPAAAQECETDADCGFGFQCYSETLVGTTNTTATTTNGGFDGSSSGGAPTSGSSGDSADGDDAGTDTSTDGSSTPVCGDNQCQPGETWEACPADCERYSYCAGATCEADSDCAEGYQCQAGGGNTSGSPGGWEPVCGDGLCDASEIESCESDCVSICQQVFDTCETDADCDEGYFCSFDQG